MTDAPLTGRVRDKREAMNLIIFRGGHAACETIAS
jgi:hypothetical protein